MGNDFGALAYEYKSFSTTHDSTLLQNRVWASKESELQLLPLEGERERETRAHFAILLVYARALDGFWNRARLDQHFVRYCNQWYIWICIFVVFAVDGIYVFLFVKKKINQKQLENYHLIIVIILYKEKNVYRSHFRVLQLKILPSISIKKH